MWPGKHAASTPDKPAIIMAATGETVTYKELNDRSNQLAQLFWKMGLRFGDHIAVLMDNNPRYLEVCWAAQRSGLFYTALNWHFTAEEAAYIIDDCDAEAIVVSDGTREVAGAARRPDAEGEDPARGRRPQPSTATSTTTTPSPRSRPSRSTKSSRERRCSTRRAPPGDRRASSTTSSARRSAPRRSGSRGDDHVLRLRRVERLPLARAALPLGSALLLHEQPAARRDRRGDGAVRPAARARVHRALPRHAQPVGADDVRADVEAHRRGTQPLRPLVAPGRGARRRAVPGRREAAHDRVVGPDHHGVLLGDRRRGRDDHRRRRLARAPRFGRAQHARTDPHRRRRPATSCCPPGEIGVVWFEPLAGRPGFEYHKDPRRRATR